MRNDKTFYASKLIHALTKGIPELFWCEAHTRKLDCTSEARLVLFHVNRQRSRKRVNMMPQYICHMIQVNEIIQRKMEWVEYIMTLWPIKRAQERKRRREVRYKDMRIQRHFQPRKFIIWREFFCLRFWESFVAFTRHSNHKWFILLSLGD
jgi:hypothetical protein